MTYVYDGTLVYDETTTSKSFFGKLKGALGVNTDADANYLKLDKAGELQKGILAMLPDWSKDLIDGQTVFYMLARISDVFDRQQILAHSFIWPNSKGNGAALVNEVLHTITNKFLNKLGFVTSN